MAVALALATALLFVGSLLLWPAQAASDISDVAQGVAALTASGAAARHVRRCTDRRTRITWIFMAAACLSWALGETYWCWVTLRSDVVPFPSLADVGFLGFSVLMAVGLLVHPARGGRILFLQRVFDGLLAAGSIGLVSWLTTLGAIAGAEDDSVGLQRLLLLAYPSIDVSLVVLAVLLLIRTGGNRPALYLVSAGVLALAVSDSAFAYLAAMGFYDGGLTDLGWIGGFLLVALAGTCPEPPQPSPSVRAADAAGVTVPSSVLPYVPVVVALSVVAGVTLLDRPLTKAETMAACGVVLCLLARQYLAVRDNVHLVRQLAARDQELRRQAFFDSLTGLANRSLFRDRLEHVLELHSRDCRPVAVLFLDLDDFKAVNDTRGHAVGDDLLVRVAERITGAVRTGDTVARLGGDEFAVLLEDAGDPMHTAARIREALRRPFSLAGAEHTIEASVGVAALTADEAPVTADALLARSDAAMYAAKRAGKAGLADYATVSGAVVQSG
ncbi:diguanylate cyclase domain-containing protein [Geodermatophilus sp. CPCC 205761]|uniref:diguanylate cyclase domain-containing protein n=1 Tax=Geodermatophilus sp. CPCC 205761 TaxID=2936597 RepID=UPI003EEA2C81